jgi:predicted peroxiredoxin
MHVPGERAFLQSKRYGEFERRNAMKLLYIVTKGMNDPTLASVPLHIAANGSLEIGQEVSVVLAGDGTDLVIGDNAERMEGVGVPPMRELINKLKDHEVPVYV